MHRLMTALVALILLTGLAHSQPVVTVSPPTISFGAEVIGTTSPGQAVTLTNNGPGTLTISSIVMTGDPTDFLQSNNCGTSLQVAASCTITITFAPDLTLARSGILIITDNASPKQQKVSVSGSGVPSPEKIMPANVVFSKQEVGSTSAARNISFANNGTTALTINSITASAGFGQSNTCGSSVAAGGSCTISVTFAPTSQWTQTGSITINDSAQDSPQIIPLAGIGIEMATASLTPKSLTFASQAIGTSSSAQSVTVKNTGSATLAINSIIASGDYSETTTCGSTLTTGLSCTITVIFAPSASGTRTGYLTLNDTASPFLQTVDLSGTGTAPNTTVAVSPVVASVTPTQLQQFNAAISGVASTDVIWAVDGVTGGSTGAGMVSSSGLYTPPATGGLHTITATSIADPTQIASVPLTVTAYPGVLTYKNDIQRDGQNLTETVLTTGNVNAGQFGKLFSYPVDGYVFAQPLWLPGVTIPNQGVHNVVYIATENDSVFAFDADNAAPGMLWQASFIDPSEGITTVPAKDVEGVGSDIPVQIGITPTPVIDLSQSAIYVLARTKEVSGSQVSYVQRLHALNLTTGEEMPNSPVEISAQVSGVGSGQAGGIVAFSGKQENSRPALLEVNGVIYIMWASLGDLSPFHGWVMGYDAATMEQVALFNTTPNGADGGIWQSGGGPAADENGNIFAIVGNGTFDIKNGGIDYGDSVLKFTTSGSGIGVGDFFTPYNQATFDNLDLDLGSGGPLLLPDQPGQFPHLMVIGGKDATFYLLNRDNLGQFSPTGNNVVMYVPNSIGTQGNRGIAGYWQGQIYFAGAFDALKQFGMYNGLASASPLTFGTYKFNYPGAEAAVSANGNTNGIVWVVEADAFKTSGPAVLRAYDGANVARELFDTTTLSSNTAGPSVKFSVPTIANAKVYLGTETELDVFGLLP